MTFYPKKKHKYRAKKVVIDGITFDSKAEAMYYNHLKFLKKAGVVKNFSQQVEYILQDKFEHPSTGKTVRAIKYVPDFLIAYTNGKSEVVDVKGMQTKEFKLKAKLFINKYQVPLTLAKYDYKTGKFIHEYF
ncbi:DUF1064 domain-containing protein [Facklamia miroungae]|uniref:DUF1064 domain-containing protein n=1 Tax=Facklamia miroungae TaxID=120956 RepID=A0A1G7NYX4_9LACT|nr:DUF1064 domain-containing protein [Facklamia miroungae]NKZ28521.1 DUF1064 domain-containing protein [Facklamia miroungae]SDF79255.1 Protein of unknown function [Facklamia miroungae]